METLDLRQVEPQKRRHRGLRRAELLVLRLESIQLRKEHWVIADLGGKAAHVRTAPILTWVNVAVDAWTTAAVIPERQRAGIGSALVQEGLEECQRFRDRRSVCRRSPDVLSSLRLQVCGQRRLKPQLALERRAPRARPSFAPGAAAGNIDELLGPNADLAARRVAWERQCH
jgi:GNAT superfamily N-acetyltransferase